MKRITAILTVDDNGGIGFDGKRQSRDREIVKDICTSLEGKIYMNEYSAKLFGEYADRIEVCDNPILKCADGCACFLEGQGIGAYIENIDRVILYKWNKVYPADKYFDAIDVLEAGNLAQTKEFNGFSHDKITKEVYRI